MARKITHRRAAAILLRSRIEDSWYDVENLHRVRDADTRALVQAMNKITEPMIDRLDRLAGDLSWGDVSDAYERYGDPWDD
jgi:formiminotetrahydrofolate cyclodeaminase